MSAKRGEPITDFEREIIATVSRATFIPGTGPKRFIRDCCSGHTKQLTGKGRWYLAFAEAALRAVGHVEGWDSDGHPALEVGENFFVPSKEMLKLFTAELRSKGFIVTRRATVRPGKVRGAPFRNGHDERRANMQASQGEK